ncbi:MAG: hypothetical protein II254_03150, partial [Oscillospiraceae bacterium]|nr:hypothetical protein [Oscillospiraceae bacterium]
YFDRGAKPCSLFRPLGALRKLCSVSFGYKRNGWNKINKSKISFTPKGFLLSNALTAEILY